jgi:hypothetical protein
VDRERLTNLVRDLQTRKELPKQDSNYSRNRIVKGGSLHKIRQADSLDFSSKDDEELEHLSAVQTTSNGSSSRRPLPLPPS